MKNIFKIFGTPLQTKRINFTYRVLGIKIEVKGCVELISERIFEKYSKMKILGLNF